MEKIGIVTVHTGYNYGTSLQVYSSKLYYEKLGYKPEILGYSNSLVKGRDIRIKKISTLLLRTFFRPVLFKKTFLTYKKSLSKEVTLESKKMFDLFTEEKLKVKKMNEKEMKNYAETKEVLALICGSDQIWNATSVYVDSFYYLQFAPKEKRIAYAPSFGKSEIPDYNKKIIKKYLSGFEYLSVRETEGQKLIKELTGKDSEVLIDPTLLISKEEWGKEIEETELPQEMKKDYIVYYFLDTPSESVLENLKKIAEEFKCEIISLPFKHENFENFGTKVTSLDTGPLEFVKVISNAKFVCTDSFHGMLFSINLNVPFYIFARNYGTATNQSTRITSILDILDLRERFIEKEKTDLTYTIQWHKANQNLDLQREKSKQYLERCFKKIREKNEK